jgi:hypothetical protein
LALASKHRVIALATRDRIPMEVLEATRQKGEADEPCKRVRRLRAVEAIVIGSGYGNDSVQNGPLPLGPLRHGGEDEFALK